MDNFHLDITSDKDLEKCLVLATRNFQASHRKQEDTERGKRLIFAWADPREDGWVPFPYPIRLGGIVVMAEEWLGQQRPKEPQPGIDGDVRRGFRVYCEDGPGWAGTPYAFVAIEPVWALYGK